MTTQRVLYFRDVGNGFSIFPLHFSTSGALHFQFAINSRWRIPTDCPTSNFSPPTSKVPAAFAIFRQLGFPQFVGTAGDIITQYQSEPGVPVINWGEDAVRGGSPNCRRLGRFFDRVTVTIPLALRSEVYSKITNDGSTGKTARPPTPS